MTIANAGTSSVAAGGAPVGPEGPDTGSRKTYLIGSRADIRVPMREVVLASGDAVVLYDTSGPYTDPGFTPDVRRGLPAVRDGWIVERGDTEEYVGRPPRPEDNGRWRGDERNLDAIFRGSGRRPRRAVGGPRRDPTCLRPSR